MQRFNSRNYSVRDFAEWAERDELVLSPKFQRRDVWNAKARSYLMDTIIRGKPIPKIYMRMDINPQTRRAKREIVDGQQRLRTVLAFLKDGFKISRVHNDDCGGRYFSGLPQIVQTEILKYEFVVDLLDDMPDSDIYDVFARINTYTERLRPQELRNARWFGDFKSCAYGLAQDLLSFFEKSQIFTPKQILRMAEAEFISDLLLAMHEGIRAGSKQVLDKAYADYDDRFLNRKRHEKRFKETIDIIGQITGDDFPTTKFRATRLFYPLFCAVYHMQFRLPRLVAPRRKIKTSSFAKLKTVLDQIDSLVNEAVDAEKRHENPKLSAEERKFYEAYDEHWVHAANRIVLTRYLCREFVKVLR